MQKDYVKLRKVATNMVCTPLLFVSNNLELAAKHVPEKADELITSQYFKSFVKR